MTAVPQHTDGDHVELVVLLDDDGAATGTAPKATVHHERTPLHLAFSCYVFDGDGRLLITQRAHHKPTFPGVWTNSVCGHPAPGEDLHEAVTRRAEQELGLELASLTLAVPTFRYEAVGENGVREHELCPVFTATAVSGATADPAEVAELAWVPWTSFRDEVLDGTRTVSPWCAEQVAELASRELEDGRFEPASPSTLPPAARPDDTVVRSAAARRSG
jgi:isopentenyl-diphosphate delta-isomerase